MSAERLDLYGTVADRGASRRNALVILICKFSVVTLNKIFKISIRRGNRVQVDLGLARDTDPQIFHFRQIFGNREVET